MFITSEYILKDINKLKSNWLKEELEYRLSDDYYPEEERKFDNPRYSDKSLLEDCLLNLDSLLKDDSYIHEIWVHSKKVIKEQNCVWIGNGSITPVWDNEEINYANDVLLGVSELKKLIKKWSK